MGKGATSRRCSEELERDVVALYPSSGKPIGPDQPVTTQRWWHHAWRSGVRETALHGNVHG